MKNILVMIFLMSSASVAQAEVIELAGAQNCPPGFSELFEGIIPVELEMPWNYSPAHGMSAPNPNAGVDFGASSACTPDTARGYGEYTNIPCIVCTRQ